MGPSPATSHQRINGFKRPLLLTSQPRTSYHAWIVRRIDIGDRKRPFAVNLNDGLLPDRRRRRPRLPDGRAAHWYAEGAEPQQAAAYLATPRTRENPQDREMISQPA